MSSIKEQVKQLAQQHGFALCTFARPDILPRDSHALDTWIEAGMYGDMAYMAEDVRTFRRKNPVHMLEHIQTIISLAMPYSPPTHQQVKPTQGVIASYAHGDDYHEVMKKRLKALARDLDVLLGRHGQRVYVDTAPVLEHALAAKGGLAWQGKHSLSINREYGSWFLLAELFTTADLPPDTSATLHCGTCTACLDDCPTGAIVSPYVVDARLCISYLTIEFKGFIPVALRPLMGNRIFGCDDCQLVCPWNDKLEKPEHDFLTPRKDTYLPNLVSLLRLDEHDFRVRFRKSPVKRTGRAGLLRNVCIAMGNSQHQAFIPELLKVLGDAEALIRGHAVWALAQLMVFSNDADRVREQIYFLLEKEEDEHVLIELAQLRRKYDH